jgi:hypothetical protein
VRWPVAGGRWPVARGPWPVAGSVPWPCGSFGHCGPRPRSAAGAREEAVGTGSFPPAAACSPGRRCGGAPPGHPPASRRASEAGAGRDLQRLRPVLRGRALPHRRARQPAHAGCLRGAGVARRGGRLPLRPGGTTRRPPAAPLGLGRPSAAQARAALHRGRYRLRLQLRACALRRSHLSDRLIPRWQAPRQPDGAGEPRAEQHLL